MSVSPTTIASPFVPAHVKPVTKPLSLPEIAIRARRNALETMPALAYRQPIVSGRTFSRWHFVTGPEALKRVLLDNVDNYPKSPMTQRLLKPAIGVSIFTSEGDEWRWQRRAAAPVFSHRNMSALTPMMSAAADRTAERLERSADNGFDGVGAACVMQEMVTATFDVVTDALLGGAAGAEVGLDRARIGAAITRYLETVGRISFLDLISAPNWIPRPAQLLHGRVMNETTAMVDALIARRRAALDAGEQRDDLVDYLLRAEDAETGRRMDDATLRNNLLSFIVAGHETTALALAWAMYLLANDPQVQERAAEEAAAALGERRFATSEDLPKLGYIGQVIDEAMRLYPPAAILSRQAREADVLCDREIQPGDLVILPIYALHRHEMLWDRPNAFDPERFAPEAVKQRHRFAYLPFGAGPRICIGMRFAVWEAQIILATILARLRVLPKPGRQPKPVMTVTLRPEGGMPLRMARR